MNSKAQLVHNADQKDSSELEFLNILWGLGTVEEYGCRTGGIGSLESILGLLKSLKIRTLDCTSVDR